MIVLFFSVMGVKIVCFSDRNIFLFACLWANMRKSPIANVKRQMQMIYLNWEIWNMLWTKHDCHTLNNCQTISQWKEQKVRFINERGPLLSNTSTRTCHIKSITIALSKCVVKGQKVRGNKFELQSYLWIWTLCLYFSQYDLVKDQLKNPMSLKMTSFYFWSW